MNTVKYKQKETRFEDVLNVMQADGSTAYCFDSTDPHLIEFAEWLKEKDPDKLLGLPSEILTEEYVEAVVKAAPGKIIFAPTRFKTERIVIAAINSAVARGEEPPSLTFIPPDKVTNSIQDAYIAAGGYYLYNISPGKMTTELIDRAIEKDSCINIGHLPIEEQTEERWKKCLTDYPAMLENVPSERLNQSLCDTAMEKGTFFVYKTVPKKLRTEAMLIQALKNLRPDETVAAVLRISPASIKTDKSLAVAYEELLKELDPKNPRSHHSSAGKVKDASFERYIQKQGKVTIPAPMSAPVFIPERTADSYANEELRNIYTALYEMNMEAADDDYLEEFKRYAPENLAPDRGSLISGLQSLAGELLDDLGSKQELISWMDMCGASAPLRDFLLN